MPGERRIALGLKQALGDPWEDALKKYAVGAIAEGPVTSLTNFGCFVDLGGGVDGMIHISDITREKRLNHPREALTAGQTVRAVVLEVDQERRRIKLGIKQLEPTTADEYIAEHQVGESVTGRIVGGDQGPGQSGAGRGRFRRVPDARRCGQWIESRFERARAGRRQSRPWFANRNVISQMEAGTHGGSGPGGGSASRDKSGPFAS